MRWPSTALLLSALVAGGGANSVAQPAQPQFPKVGGAFDPAAPADAGERISPMNPPPPPAQETAQPKPGGENKGFFEIPDQVNRDRPPAGQNIPTRSPAKAPPMDVDDAPIDVVPPGWQGKGKSNMPIKAPDQSTVGLKRVYFDETPITVNLVPSVPAVIELPAWEQIDGPEGALLGNTTAFGSRLVTDQSLVVFPKVAAGVTPLWVRGRSGRTYTFFLHSRGLSYDVASDTRVIVDVAQPRSAVADLGDAGLERWAWISMVAPAPAGSVAVQPKPAPRAAGGWLSNLFGGGSANGYPTARGSAAAGDAIPALGNPSPTSVPRREFAIDPTTLRAGDFIVQAVDEPSAAIAPARVFHDGRGVFIDFGPHADFGPKPVIARVIDDSDQPVYGEWLGAEGTIYAIPGAPSDMTVRHGQRIVCILYRPQGRQAAAKP